MTAPHLTSPEIHFLGAQSAAAKGAQDKMAQLLEQSSGGQKLLGRALRVQEGDNGLSVVTFIQNNLVALLPKWVVSRSPVESAEFSFLELAESSLLYFALPFFGNRLFQPLFKNIAKKEFQTLEQKAAAETGIRAATILSTIGVTLVGGEFVTHYLKNLMTAKVFKKDRFSDIVNLSQGKLKDNQHSDVVQKSKTRIKQCLAGCAGILGASVLLARSPEKFTLLKKASENVSNKLVKHLDFGKGQNGKLCLGKNQMRLYMALAVFAYMDSARDKLERVETATRLAVILPYLAFGQGLLEKGMLKLGRDYFKPLLDPNNPHKILSLKQLAEQAGHGDQAAAKFTDVVKRKSVYTGVPLAFGVFGTGIGVGLLNRFWTKYRYNKQLAEQQQLPISAKPNTIPQSIATPLDSSPVSPGALPISSPLSVVSSAPALAGRSVSPYSQSFAPTSHFPVPQSQAAFPSTASPFNPNRFNSSGYTYRV